MDSNIKPNIPSCEAYQNVSHLWGPLVSPLKGLLPTGRVVFNVIPDSVPLAVKNQVKTALKHTSALSIIDVRCAHKIHVCSSRGHHVEV